MVWLSNFYKFCKLRGECCEVCEDGDYDPEELLAHSDDAPDPGEQGEGLYGQMGRAHLHLSVESHKHPIPGSIRRGVGVIKTLIFKSES